MLSRVAEHIYWLARYLERAEDTTRLINATTQLKLDLPLSVPLSWHSLVASLGLKDKFQGADQADEQAVMSYLINDPQNPSSILSCARRVKDNARVIRDVLPRSAWEQINTLSLFIEEDGQQITSRWLRSNFLQQLILRFNGIVGAIDSAMSRDVAFQFLQVGRYIERADMTSRIIDTRATNLLPSEAEDWKAFSKIGWMSLLTALDGYEMYRRSINNRVRRSDVMHFIVCDMMFPRSLFFALEMIKKGFSALPGNTRVSDLIHQLIETTGSLTLEGKDFNDIHQIIDEVQIAINSLHEQLASHYFSFVMQDDLSIIEQ